MVPFLFSQGRDDLWEFEPLHRALVARPSEVEAALKKDHEHWEHEIAGRTKRAADAKRVVDEGNPSAGEKAQLQARLRDAEGVIAGLKKN